MIDWYLYKLLKFFLILSVSSLKNTKIKMSIQFLKTFLNQIPQIAFNIIYNPDKNSLNSQTYNFIKDF